MSVDRPSVLRWSVGLHSSRDAPWVAVMWLATVFAWLWSNTAGNLVASGMCLVIGYMWKIRPHLLRQAEHRVDVETHMLAQDDRHRQVEAWFTQVHDRFDKLEQPGRHAERDQFHGQIKPDQERQ